MFTTHPRARIIALSLWLAGALLAGCQGVTTLPTPRAAEAPTRDAGYPGNGGPLELPEPDPSASTAPAASASTPAAPPARTPTKPSTAGSSAASAAPTADLATIESLDANRLPRRDFVQLAFEYGRSQSAERVARTQPLDAKVGDKQTFNVTSLETNETYTIEATLVFIFDHVLAYVEDGVEVDLNALEQSMRQFNDTIYDRNRDVFGTENAPGVDGDPRLTILNARIAGAGGYFGSRDTMPKSANNFSNEREMFYINVASQVPGSSTYGGTLAHEFQHMIEANVAERPTIWFNEGLSQLAEELNGFGDEISTPPAYLINPDLQLTDWGNSPNESIGHYGAAYLFMSYLYEQYGRQLDLQRLIREGGGDRLELFTELVQPQNPAIKDFGDLYADWSIANLVNDPRYGDGRYAYKRLPNTVEPTALTDKADDTVFQFGSDFYQIDASRQERVLRFDGSDTIGVVEAKPEGAAMWWSNRGDNAESTLSRTLDLRNVQSATLQFRLWYNIEADYDYGFVSVSTDGGQTFTAVAGRYTTTDDPQGYNFGNGYTGVSGGGETPQWVDEQIDLTPYAGKEIVLRFSVVSDDAVTEPGMVIDNVRVPEVNFSDDAEALAEGWTTEGWTRTNNELPQRWEVRLVRVSGRNVTFEPLELDANNVGEYRLAANERGALIVMATTPHTTERASYTITVK